MSSSSYTSYREDNRNQDVTHKTHCECEPPHLIPVQVAWTLENPGEQSFEEDEQDVRCYGGIKQAVAHLHKQSDGKGFEG
ncbi:hypothetical protein Tco_0049943 [Tanacetum coccineum]